MIKRTNFFVYGLMLFVSSSSAGEISGRVSVNGTSTPAVGAKIEACEESVATNRFGNYRLDSGSARQCRFRVVYQDRRSNAITVDAAAAETSLNVELRRLGDGWILIKH